MTFPLFDSDFTLCVSLGGSFFCHEGQMIQKPEVMVLKRYKLPKNVQCFVQILPCNIDDKLFTRKYWSVVAYYIHGAWTCIFTRKQSIETVDIIDIISSGNNLFSITIISELLKCYCRYPKTREATVQLHSTHRDGHTVGTK